MDCLKGIVKARSLGFFDLDSFDVEEYEYFEQVEVRFEKDKFQKETHLHVLGDSLDLNFFFTEW